jgi:MFS family permease
VFLPLWGDSLGLTVAEIGFIASMSFAADAAIFYPVGIIMDRFGRKWAAVPCSLTLGISFFILPFAGDFYSFMAVGLVAGIGNGFGSGINQTLGADFAPDVGRGEFLGVWRLMADIGSVGGPLLISGFTGIGGLALASVCSGGVGLVGAAVMFFLVPEPLKRRLLTKPAPEPGTH